jgi:hypothetical protein
MNAFDFLSMLGNYEERKVANTNPTKLVDVSDCGIASLCETVGGSREYPLETLN